MTWGKVPAENGMTMSSTMTEIITSEDTVIIITGQAMIATAMAMADITPQIEMIDTMGAADKVESWLVGRDTDEP
jgi:ActR/RegA family two-component response regulator